MTDRNSRPTQKTRVFDYMKDFGSITSIEAYADLGVMRLSARIFEIRALGIAVEDENVTRKNRYDECVNFKKYWLTKEAVKDADGNDMPGVRGRDSVRGDNTEGTVGNEGSSGAETGSGSSCWTDPEDHW